MDPKRDQLVLFCDILKGLLLEMACTYYLAHPLGPVKRGGGRTQTDEEHHDDISFIDRRLEGRPFGDQHSKRCKEHPCYTYEHEECQFGEQIQQSVHILYISGMKAVLRGSHILEKQGFRNGVEEHQEYSCPDRLTPAHPGTGHHQSQI